VKGAGEQGRMRGTNDLIVNILYIWGWKICPLRLTIKMRAVDKSLIFLKEGF